MKKIIIAGNWKMNAPPLADFGTGLVSAVPTGVTAIIFPPFPYITSARRRLGTYVGAQDVSEYESGAHTGDVSAAQLRELGAGYVLVGHSERRQYHGESDALINAQARAALAAGLYPIICVGESLEQRQSGQTRDVLRRQTLAAIANVSVADLSRLIFAYEPVWAIGTGLAAAPEDAATGAAAIFGASDAVASADCPILYGGSVTPENAEELLRAPGVSGALVGGASLDATAFSRIIEIAAAISSTEDN
jgi:triosephosphate isomerase